MMSLAVAPPSTTRLIGLLGRNGDDLDAGLVQPQIELAAPCLTEPRLDHHSGLEHGSSRDQSDGILGDVMLQGRRVGLVERDRDDRRGIDYHQLGSPFLS